MAVERTKSPPPPVRKRRERWLDSVPARPRRRWCGSNICRQTAAENIGRRVPFVLDGEPEIHLANGRIAIQDLEVNGRWRSRRPPFMGDLHVRAVSDFV